jgi:hypothetical protein
VVFYILGQSLAAIDSSRMPGMHALCSCQCGRYTFRCVTIMYEPSGWGDLFMLSRNAGTDLLLGDVPAMCCEVPIILCISHCSMVAMTTRDTLVV